MLHPFRNRRKHLIFNLSSRGKMVGYYDVLSCATKRVALGSALDD